MIEPRAGRGIDTHAHDASKEKITRKAGSALTRNLGAHRNDGRLKALFGKARFECLVSVYGENAGRHASLPKRRGDNGPTGLARERHLVRGSSYRRRAPDKR